MQQHHLAAYKVQNVERKSEWGTLGLQIGYGPVRIPLSRLTYLLGTPLQARVVRGLQDLPFVPLPMLAEAMGLVPIIPAASFRNKSMKASWRSSCFLDYGTGD